MAVLFIWLTQWQLKANKKRQLTSMFRYSYQSYRQALGLLGVAFAHLAARPPKFRECRFLVSISPYSSVDFLVWFELHFSILAPPLIIIAS